jgi:hypothetical protein
MPSAQHTPTLGFWLLAFGFWLLAFGFVKFEPRKF